MGVRGAIGRKVRNTYNGLSEWTFEEAEREPV